MKTVSARPAVAGVTTHLGHLSLLAAMEIFAGEPMPAITAEIDEADTWCRHRASRSPA